MIASVVAAASSHTLPKLRASSADAARPFITAFADLVAAVGSAADAKAVLAASDAVRDDVLPPLGVRLEDRAAGQPAIWKRDNPEEIMREVQRKREAAGAKAAATKAAAAEREAKEAAKREKAKINPRDMFRAQTDAFSQWDAEGVPTHDAAGKELSKNALKKLKKQWDDQDALFKAAAAASPAAAAAQL
jgi:cysteinyl-tRNA synthetase